LTSSMALSLPLVGWLFILLTTTSVAVQGKRLKSSFYNDTAGGRASVIGQEWPDGIVPYVMMYKEGAKQIPMLRSAMHRLSAVSCLQFRPKTNQDTAYIQMENTRTASDCFARGTYRANTVTILNMGDDCSEGNAVHEILHALGFRHEQVREDRDRYVRVNCENIQCDRRSQYKKSAAGTTTPYGAQYNYESIMHYGNTFFIEPGKKTTMDPIKGSGAVGDPNNMGQRERIADTDILMLNRRYKCPSTTGKKKDPGPLKQNEYHPQEDCENYYEEENEGTCEIIPMSGGGMGCIARCPGHHNEADCTNTCD